MRIYGIIKNNKYHIYGDTVFVKFTNCNEYFLCDLDDWEILKEHAWMKSKDGYAVANIGGKQPKMHRMIMGTPKGMVTDHICPISSGVVDNRKSNLRVCTQKENTQKPSQRANTISGYTGVVYDKKKDKWFARITVDGKTHFKGYFNSKEDAIKGRINLEKEYKGRMM